MFIYRFRITSDELENFLREIEIQPNQTFQDFHTILIESVDLVQCERASFFPTDKKYIKDIEITLKPEKRQVRKYDEDLDIVVTDIKVIPLMKDSKIKTYIEDPHQKMIYEFHGKEDHSFFIELFKIVSSDGYPSYPQCIKKIGELPKKVEPPSIQQPLPVKPRAIIPKIPFPKVEELAKLDEIVEDETELAEIENQIGEIFEEEGTVAIEETTQASGGEEEHFSYHPEEGQMEHIEDYDDIEMLDKRLSGYDRDPDDY